METHPIKLYWSRSACVKDWTCPRARWYGYEYAGRGLSPATIDLNLFIGICVHDAIAALVAGVDIDVLCAAANQQMHAALDPANGNFDELEFAKEQACLVEGMIRGYHRHVWPIFREDYPTIVASEREFVYEHDGLSFLSKPDLLVRDAIGDLHYIEFKTAAYVKEQWINQWQTAVQLHSSVKAVEATLGEKVMSVIVQAFLKGGEYYGKQGSIFCYGYARAAEPPFTKAVLAYEYKAGLRKFPVWELPGGVKEWVAKMPTNVLSQQFPQVPPIFPNDDLVNAFFRQRATREHQIKGASARINGNELTDAEKQTQLDDYFPQVFEKCNPGFGFGCEFRTLCHGFHPDPLEAGFSLRTSHHALEEAQLLEQEKQ